MADREKVIKELEEVKEYIRTRSNGSGSKKCRLMDACNAAIILLKEQEAVVRCKDCKYWDKTTREEGNDCILGPWEDAVCDVFREWDGYGELGDSFRRTNGEWFCADGERRDG